MGKKALRLDVTRNTSDMSVKFDVLNAADEVVYTDTFYQTDFAENLWDEQTVYGISKVFMDRTSSWKEDPIGKVKAMREIYLPVFASGLWDKPRVTDGQRVTSIEEEALARHYKYDVPTTQRKLKAYTKEQRAVIFGTKVIKDLIAVITAERTAQPAEIGGDFDDLLKAATE